MGLRKIVRRLIGETCIQVYSDTWDPDGPIEEVDASDSRSTTQDRDVSSAVIDFYLDGDRQ